MDFMIDEDFKTYLIEINTNPCYETPSSLLSRLIPKMIDNALMFYLVILRIAVDSIYNPPLDLNKFQGTRKELISSNVYDQNRFELIFDELVHGINL